MSESLVEAFKKQVKAADMTAAEGALWLNSMFKPDPLMTDADIQHCTAWLCEMEKNDE